MKYIVTLKLEADQEHWGHLDLPEEPTKEQMLEAVAPAVKEMEEALEECFSDMATGEVILCGLFPGDASGRGVFRNVLTIGRFDGETYPPKWGI